MADELDAWAKRVERQSVRAMKRLAAECEWLTRENKGWERDTGSAEAAITSYLVGQDNPRKNYADPAWQTAQRKGGIRWPNPPHNYYPQENTIDAPDKALSVATTTFVKYAPTLEFGWMVGSLTFTRSFEEAADLFVHIVGDFLGAV